MCLAVPGKVVEWTRHEPPFAAAMVEFGGVRRSISMECVPEALEGDYVLVHAGIAISRIDAKEAEKVLETLRELEDEDWRPKADMDNEHPSDTSAFGLQPPTSPS